MANRLKAWAGDQALRRLVQNAGTLVVGNAMQSMLGLASLAITARALGPSDFGKLAIAVAYALLITQLLGFQSWQAVIRYGAAALERARPSEFAGVVKVGIVLDVSTATIAALVATAGAVFGAELIGLDSDSRAIGLLASVAIVANIVSTPTALLRIFDRYRLFVIQAFLTSLLKLTLVGIVYYAEGGLLAFTAAWVGSQVFGYVLLASLALREFRRRHYTLRGAERIGDIFRRHPELPRFFVVTNLNGTARMLRDLDVPLLGWLLGPAATGSFKIARQLAGALNKVIDPFFYAIYPDLAKLHAAGQTGSALRLVRRSSLMLGAVAGLGLAAFVAVGEPVMVAVLGEEFRHAYPVTAWCVAGAAVWAFAQPFSPMLMALGRQSALLVINLVATAAYLAAIVFAARYASLTVIGAAFAGFLLLWALLCAGEVLRTSARSMDSLRVSGTTP